MHLLPNQSGPVVDLVVLQRGEAVEGPPPAPSRQLAASEPAAATVTAVQEIPQTAVAMAGVQAVAVATPRLHEFEASVCIALKVAAKAFLVEH